MTGCRPREDETKNYSGGGPEGVILCAYLSRCSPWPKALQYCSVLSHLGDGVPSHMSKISSTSFL